MTGATRRRHAGTAEVVVGKTMFSDAFNEQWTFKPPVVRE